MKSISAKDAKDSIGGLIATAHAAPLVLEKHAQQVVVLSAEEYERQSAVASAKTGA
jgi:PHD/YefM family antitoxin component YafN of YafNO toxin-antitoxin module